MEKVRQSTCTLTAGTYIHGGQWGGEPSTVLAELEHLDVMVELQAGIEGLSADAKGGICPGWDGWHPKMAAGMVLLLKESFPTFATFLHIPCTIEGLLEMLLRLRQLASFQDLSCMCQPQIFFPLF